MERAAAFRDARRGRALPTALAERHPAVAAVVRQLLDPDPAGRPTAAALLHHPLGAASSGAAAPARAAAPAAASPEPGGGGGGGDGGGGGGGGRVEYRGAAHSPASLLALLKERDGEIAALRRALVELRAARAGGARAGQAG